MLPFPCFVIASATALLHKRVVVRFSRRIASQNLSLCCKTGLLGPPPTLLTRISTRLNSSSVLFTMLATCSLSCTSVGTGRALLPRARISSAVFSMSAAVRAATTTSAPACARPKARAFPIPLPAPVTMATLFVKENNELISTPLDFESFSFPTLYGFST